MQNTPQSFISKMPVDFLMLAFAMLTLFSCWFCTADVNLYGIILDMGILIFSIALFVCLCIVEFFNYQKAQNAILLGLIFSIVTIVYNQLAYYLPSPEFAEKMGQMYNPFVEAQAKSAIDFFQAYLISTFFGMFILAKSKAWFYGEKIFIRMAVVFFLSIGMFSILFKWFYH